MAARENQTLHVVVALFGVTIAVLAVLTYFFFKKWDEEYARASSLQGTLTSEQTASRAAQDEANLYKETIGFSAEDTQETILTEIHADQDRFALNFTLPTSAQPDDSQPLLDEYGDPIAEGASGAGEMTVQVPYRELTRALFNELVQSKNAEAAARKRADQLDAELASLREQSNAQIAALTQEKQTIEQNYNNARDEYNRARQAMIADGDKTFEQMITDLTKLATTGLEQGKQIEGLEQKLTTLENTNDNLSDRLREASDESFEVPDGMVMYVDQRLGKAFINLGFADGLRPKVTFSVFATDENDAAYAYKKGSLEVTTVLGEHLAEALIDDKINDPVLPGDMIYSPAWNIGERIHFAFAGVIDFTGDGKSDQAVVEDLIRQSDGVVDEVLTQQTRYLIDGGVPELEDLRPDPALQKLISDYSGTIEEANRLGVKRLKLRSFLDSVGYQPYGAKAVSLGDDADPNNFPARSPKDNPPTVRVPMARQYQTPQPSRLKNP